MDRGTLPWTTLLVLAIGAFALSAATVESAVTTDPDDVVDLDYDSLPIDQEEAADVQSEMETAATEQREAGGGETGYDRSLLDRLLALLAALVRPLLILATLLGAAAVAVRYGRGLFERSVDDLPRESVPPRIDPDNPIEEQWQWLIRRVDVDRPTQRTTAEYRNAAIDAGFDPDAVTTLAETFEEVRYGGRPVTDERIETARGCARRLALGGER